MQPKQVTLLPPDAKEPPKLKRRRSEPQLQPTKVSPKSAARPATSGAAGAASSPGTKPRSRGVVRTGSLRRPKPESKDLESAKPIASAPVSPNAGRREPLTQSCPPSVLRAARQQLEDSGLARKSPASGSPLAPRKTDEDDRTPTGSPTPPDAPSVVVPTISMAAAPCTECAQLAERVRTLEMELAVRPTTADVETARGDREALQAQKMSLEAQLEVLQAQMDEYNAGTVQVHELRANLELARKQLAEAHQAEEELTQQLASAKQALVNTVKQLKKEHMEATDALQSELARVRMQHNQHAESVETSKDTVKRLKQTNERALRELQEAHAAELQAERQQKSEAKAALQQLTLQVEQLQSQLAAEPERQQAALAATQQQLEQQRTEAAEAMRQTITAQWEEDVQQLSRSHQETVDNLRAQLDVARQDLAQFQESVKVAEESRESAGSALDQRLRDLTAHSAELTTANDKLHADNAKLQSDLAHAHKREADLEALADIATKAKEQAEQALRAAQQQHQQQQQQQTSAGPPPGTEAQLQRLEQAQQELQAQLTSTRAELQDTRQRLEAANSRTAQLEQQLAQSSAAAAAPTSTPSAGTSGGSGAVPTPALGAGGDGDGDLDRARFELESLRHVLEMKNNENKELRKKNLSLEREIDKHLNTSTQNSDELVRLQRQNEELEAALEAKRKAHDNILIEMARVQDTAAQVCCGKTCLHGWVQTG